MPFTEKLKSKVRRKAHLACCLCKEMGVEVHHIIPEEDGGPDTEDNAAPLCPTCHETYGANPRKRKFIREARELWYEICEKRYASDADRIDELNRLLKQTVSYEDFLAFKDELFSHIVGGLDTPRSEEEIVREMDILFDKIWYNRHQTLLVAIESGKKTLETGVWKLAVNAAKEVEKKYPKGELGPWEDYEW